MSKYRYRPTGSLPQQASAAEVSAIVEALTQGRYELDRLANRYVTGPWNMTGQAFVNSILDHLNAARCLFHKTVKNPPPTGTSLFHANVSLDFETDDEEQDVYVEIQFRGGVRLTIYDAHNHPRGEPRLPKQIP